MKETKVKQGRDIVDQKDTENIIMFSPPFPKRLTLIKPLVSSDFDLIGELKDICIKIPFLQDIQDIPMYVKTIKELCGKK